MGWVKIDSVSARLTQKIDAACLNAVNDTTAAAAIEAKRSHPGWNNRTGTLEGSVRIEPATKIGADRYQGSFGSYDVVYALPIEVLHGHFLRNAADIEFSKLGANLRKELG